MITIGEPNRHNLCEVRWNGKLTQWCLEKVAYGYRMIKPDGTIVACDTGERCKAFLSRRFASTIGASELEDQ